MQVTDAEASRLRDLALDAATNGVVIVDALAGDCPVVYANGGFLRMTGYRREEVLGRNCRFLQGPHPDRAANAEFRSAMAERRSTTVRVRNFRQDGTPFHNQVVISPMHGESGRVTHYVGVLTDITDQILAEEEARFLALCDPLTGLWNRRALQERLTRRCVTAEAGASDVALLYIDLDEFKAVNDQHGHEAGDRFLVGVADRFRDALPAGAFLARQGGDEFSVVLHGSSDTRETAIATAASLCDSLQAPIALDHLQVAASASVGISLYPHDADSAAELLRHADHAMYVAKREGGSVSRCFTGPHGARRSRPQQHHILR